jgi:hypothetical protein
LCIALLVAAVLAILAAGLRAFGKRPAFTVGGVAVALADVGFGAFAGVPPWMRGIALLHAATLLGKIAALGRARIVPPGLAGWAYLLVYPCLDPAVAFDRDPVPDRRAGLISLALGIAECAAACVSATIAERAGLLAGPAHEAAWARAVSFVLLLDGTFRWTGGALRAVGLRSEVLSRSPWFFADLGDFWARRWNRFVGKSLALEVYAPVRRRAGRVAAVVATFLVSGVVHEALFTLAMPDGSAHAGRFTLFFVAQGAGVLASNAIPDETRVGRGARRALGWAVLLAAAPWFFGGAYPIVAPLEGLLSGWFS